MEAMETMEAMAAMAAIGNEKSYQISTGVKTT